jgi:hypothetical protein
MNFSRGYAKALAAALLLSGALVPYAVAQSGLNEPYVPRLGDIMDAVQSRHIKLWFAGKSLNWELASYELRQLKVGLVEAASLYSDIPVSNVTTMTTPVESLAASIGARDSRRFAKAFGELTDGCNACHQSMGRGFIVMRMPTVSPFGNQVFPPPSKQ